MHYILGKSGLQKFYVILGILGIVGFSLSFFVVSLSLLWRFRSRSLCVFLSLKFPSGLAELGSSFLLFRSRSRKLLQFSLHRFLRTFVVRSAGYHIICMNIPQGFRFHDVFGFSRLFWEYAGHKHQCKFLQLPCHCSVNELPKCWVS